MHSSSSTVYRQHKFFSTLYSTHKLNWIIQRGSTSRCTEASSLSIVLLAFLGVLQLQGMLHSNGASASIDGIQQDLLDIPKGAGAKEAALPLHHHSKSASKMRIIEILHLKNDTPEKNRQNETHAPQNPLRQHCVHTILQGPPQRTV